MDNSKHICPVCGIFEFEKRLSFEICEVCGWQDDIFDDNDPEAISGANEMSLAEAKEAYAKNIKVK